MDDYLQLEYDPRQVNIGLDGWLFLLGGSNDVYQLYQEPSLFTPRHAERWRELLTARAQRASALDIRYFHFFAPDKISIYPEFCTAPLTNFEGRPGHAVAQALNGFVGADAYLDAEAALRQGKIAQPVYWKTDTHWTPFGTWTVYATICRSLGIRPSVNLETAPFADYSRSMDLGSKIKPPMMETLRLYEFVKSAYIVHKNKSVLESERRGGNVPGLLSGSYVHWRNESPKAMPLSVAVFGDSFCEVRPRGLSAMLAETVRDLHFYWCPFVDFAEVKRVCADVVISEMAERFAVAVPRDDRSFNEYGDSRLEVFLASLKT